MAKKSRSKIKNENIDSGTEDDEENENENQYLSDKMDQYVDCLWEIRRKMIEYCDDNGLPLCDYLTYDAIDQFAMFLKIGL